MPRYLVRFCKGADHEGDNLVAVVSAPSPEYLFSHIDETTDPCVMEFLELPRGNKWWLRKGENAPWVRFEFPKHDPCFQPDDQE